MCWLVVLSSNIWNLMACHGFKELSVVSKSLKMLHIRTFGTCYAIEICSPNMEKLELLGQMVCSSVKLKDLPLSVSATLDFAIDLDGKTEVELFEFVKDILLQVQHVNELILGPWILMILSLGAERGEPCLSLNSKCLTVVDLYLARRVPVLAYLLLCCPMLEKLSMQLGGAFTFQHGGSVKVEKKFWESNESLFSCLMSSLKTVEIKCLVFVGVDQDELLEFAKFILENARVSERMVFLELPGRLMVFANKLCQKLSGVRKSSPHAVVEVARLPLCFMHPSLNMGTQLLMEMM